MARFRGALIAQQDFGQLRSHASVLASQNKDLDEEVVFKEMMEGWMQGLKTESIKIFGATKANKLLSIFKNG